jgi:prepilin-type N-terminal cleavage/methylation domain-containing protein
MTTAPHLPPQSRNPGFTIIEIAIVLVIIGLVVGGVIAGKDLIEAARVRSELSQIEQLNTATNTFKIKYGYLPGDMSGTIAAQFGFSTVSIADQSRFGNGFIDGVAANSTEAMYFLRNLQQANLISCTGCNPGGWDGSGATYDAIFTVAAIGNSSTIQVYGGLAPTSGYGATQNYSKNYIEICQARLSSNRAVTPAQAFALDSKIDDGLPLTGTVIATNSPYQLTSMDYWNASRTPSQGAGGSAACVSTDTTPSSYNTQNASYLCNLRFDAQF